LYDGLDLINSGTGPSLYLASEIEHNAANSLGGVILQRYYSFLDCL
jgi:hypothetical protein